MNHANVPDPAILAAWERVVRDNQPAPVSVHPEIAQAWARCRAAGTDPWQGRSTRLLDAPALAQLLARRKALIDVARPFMGNLHQFVAGSSFVVVLCDEHGTLLEAVGEPEVIRQAPDLNFSLGAVWTEEEIGNNGAGTALRLGRPVQVS
jgi:sigma-54 dependent transcriptional regulator, acetoin dehydrogenase operon transcriptional activator AcoR